MFLPLVQLPFGVNLSYFDLAFGALSGGKWSSYRIMLFTVFIINFIIFAVCSISLWGLKKDKFQRITSADPSGG
jgi:hypothetical protein